MNEDKIKELLMTLRIYLKYSEDAAEKQNLKAQLTKLVDELLPE